MSSHMCGAPSDVKHDGEAQEVLERVKGKAQSLAQSKGWNGIFTELTAVSYRTQVVAGVNYLIKARYRPNKFCHVKVYVPPGGEPSVSEIEMDKSESDPY